MQCWRGHRCVVCLVCDSWPAIPHHPVVLSPVSLLYRNATLAHRHQSPGKCLPGGSSRFDCHDSQRLWTRSCAQSRRVTQSRQSPKSPSRNQIWARSYVQSRKSRRNRKRQSAQRRHHRKRPRQISHQSKSVVFKETSRNQRCSTHSCHRVPRVLRETPYPVLTESAGIYVRQDVDLNGDRPTPRSSLNRNIFAKDHRPRFLASNATKPPRFGEC
jgi:hypothetical protein